MQRHEGKRVRRIRALMSPTDLQQIGRILVAQRSSVRFMEYGSSTVLRELPGHVDRMLKIVDSVIWPALDLPTPDVWMGDDGMAVYVITSRITPDQDMKVGEINCLLDPSNAEHLAFWGAVADVVKQVTKPHVTFFDGGKANVRVGADAEAWWLEDQSRGLLDGFYTRYRLRTQRR